MFCDTEIEIVRGVGVINSQYIDEYTKWCVANPTTESEHWVRRRERWYDHIRPIERAVCEAERLAKTEKETAEAKVRRIERKKTEAKRDVEDKEYAEIAKYIQSLHMGISTVRALYKYIQINLMYKHFLGQQEREGNLSLGRKILHILYKDSPDLPDPRPLFKQKPESDWYVPQTEDKNKLCVIEVELK